MKTTGLPPRFRIPLFALVMAGVVIFPVVVKNQYALRLGILCLMYASLAVSLNLVTGFMGQLSLGQAAFMGIGAYTSALLAKNFALPFLVTAPAALVLSALFGAALALPAIKLSGSYLAIVTLGFSEILRLVELNWVGLTRGPMGVTGIPRPNILGFPVRSGASYYYLALVLLVFSCFIVRNLLQSRYGRGIVAVREDVVAAEAMGEDVIKHKLLAFSISAGLAGMMGAYYAHYMRFIDPTAFNFDQSAGILSMVILGGSGSLPGSIVGAVLITLVPEALRRFTEVRLMLYGLVLAGVVIVKPSGLMSDLTLSRILGIEKHYAQLGLPASLETIQAVLLGQQKGNMQEGARGTELELLSVTQRFGGLTAVSEASLEVRFNEIVGLIGPNGAGKSTIFNVITGICAPTQGKVVFRGNDMTRKAVYRRAKAGMGRTFQNIRLFPALSALDNVRIGYNVKEGPVFLGALLRLPGWRRAEARTTGVCMQLLAFAGLAERADDRADSLPYGSQRKLEIVRAMAVGSFLLLDEPAAGMNEQETRDLMDFIARLKGMGFTIFLIEHDMKLVMKICERIYVQNHGVIIAQGSPEDVRRNRQVIDAYLGEDR
jgi:ABC-type branched-subunit amino acid transport system ATPase component/ABC-type branched-subunit amino acid transport system permease subunit